MGGIIGVKSMTGRLLICVSLVHLVIGWGPLTHYDIGCKALGADTENDVISCLTFQTDNVRIMGLPDSFYFDFDELQTSNCPIAWRDLHDPLLAGYAVRQALQEQNQKNLDYSLCYGVHIISDLAGFETGYMSPTLNFRWLVTWPFMLSLSSWKRVALHRCYSRPVNGSCEKYF